MKTDSIFTKNKAKRPVKNFVKVLKEDPDMYYAYQANIAMNFQDMAYHYKRGTGKKYLNRKDLHSISNSAAKNFLDHLIEGVVLWE